MAFKVGNGQGYNFVKMELRSRRIVQLLVGGLVGAVVVAAIEVASVIELSEASGRVAAGLFMTEG